MKISLSGIFSLFSFFKRRKKQAEKTTNPKWMDWARKTAPTELLQNVKKTYENVNIIPHLKYTADEHLEELYLNTALNFSGSEKLSFQDLKDGFALSLGESAGIIASPELEEELASYYLNNFYSDESQKVFYEQRKQNDQ